MVRFMELLLIYKESNTVMKVEEGDNCLSKLRQMLVIVLDSHSGYHIDDSAAERCQFQ